jgi:hypothetical protein
MYGCEAAICNHGHKTFVALRGVEYLCGGIGQVTGLSLLLRLYI